MSAAECDVPAEVLAAIDSALDAKPARLDPAADWAESAAWWRAQADFDEARADAYTRLHRWALTSGQPGAVQMAIAEACEHARAQGQEARRLADDAAARADR